MPSKSVSSVTSSSSHPLTTTKTTTMVATQFPTNSLNVLIEFAHIHLDFQRSELESLLQLHGFLLQRDYVEIPLPISDKDDERRPDPHRPFIILSFSWDKINNGRFRHDSRHEPVPESLMERYGTQIQDPPTLAIILSRCTLIRSAIELWGAGSTFSECASSIQSQLAMDVSPSSRTNSLLMDRMLQDCAVDRSWKITIQTLGWKSTYQEQEEMRSHFTFLNFLGPVKMDKPDNEFIIIREIELDQRGSAAFPRFDHNKQHILENDQRPPLGVYFGRIMGSNRNYRSGLEKFSLKRRAFLGPTSMDAELSLIMTSLAQVQRGAICFDPFVGTGSLLLTCAMKGAALCIGTDIDIRVLRGKSPDETIYNNFIQYGLPQPELIRSDNSIFHRHYRLKKPIFDAIVTDPPYGIRAGARKSGSKLDTPRPISEQDRYSHIAQTKPYAVSDVMADLLDVAARTLILGGRLVYIIPSMRDFDPSTDLPRHDCLSLVHVCYQSLQVEFGRRVVTMVKSKEYDESLQSYYLSSVWINGQESAEKCANIRERLISLAKEKEGYEEKSKYRKQRRLMAKEEKKKSMKRTVEHFDEDIDIS